MPIVGWQCSECKRAVPLDHFQNTPCGVHVCQADYAEAVLHGNDDYYGVDKVTVTSALGCPRSRAIEEQCDVTVNPLDYNSLLIGSAWDLHVASFAPEEERKVQVHGKIADTEVWGEIDRIQRIQGHLAIIDWKHQNNYAQKYTAKDGPKPEQQIQLSLYGELHEQTFGQRPIHGIIWNHYSGAHKASAPSLIPFTFLLWALEDCLSFKPFGGDYTVEQLLKQVALYQAGKTDTGVRLSALELPLVGESMSFGTAEFCSYCQVREICKVAAHGAAF